MAALYPTVEAHLAAYALLARADGSNVANGVGQLPATALLARADGRTVANGVRQLPAAALPANADGRSWKMPHGRMRTSLFLPAACPGEDNG